MGGDFRQLLPVKVRGTRTECVDLSIKKSTVWKIFRQFSLKQNMRALPEEKEFSKFLLQIGDGNLNDKDDNISIDHFPRNCIAPIDTDIAKDMYGNIFEKKKKYKKGIDYTILSPRNVDVNELNRDVVKMLDEETENIYEY